VRRPGWTVFWIAVIGVLVLVELAEITRLFTLPLGIAYLSPYTFLFSVVLITILALVGAVFVGFYLSSRIYSARGFTPFEQEMLRMHQQVTELRQELAELHRELRPGPPPSPPPPEERPPEGRT
jgi:uncharacterized membrane protein